VTPVNEDLVAPEGPLEIDDSRLFLRRDRGRQGRSAEITLMLTPPMVMTEVALAGGEGVRQLSRACGGP